MGRGEAIDEMLMIKLLMASTNEEIFNSETWTNAFNINEPIYNELCHEFYSTYEFDEVCATDELKTKKIIQFRLCGRDFSWTLLEFAKRLGLYNSKEIEEEGFDVYFQGGLHSDEHFNAQEHQNGYANVAWLIARWMKRKRAGSQKETMICCGQFITKIAKRRNLLSEEVLNDLSALIFCRDLDINTLRELIDSEGRLIPEAPKPGVPRVAIPRPSRASMYAGVFEHMVGVYNVPLQEAYNPPGYDQQQYDQYYQQHPPQQQQPDDDE
nr:hypothetical protein [Tanacetum cinerariifolium]